MNHFYEGIVGFADNCRDLYKEEVSLAQDGDVFVEVGVCLGRSLSFLVVEVINSGKDITVFGVDHWEGDGSLHNNPDMVRTLGNNWKSAGDLMYDTCVKNLQPVINRVSLIRECSWEAAVNFKDGSVAFAFIDADHGYESVKNDLAAWWPKIKSGGTLAGDDYVSCWSSVIKAVDEFVEKHNLKLEHLDGGTWRIKKP